MILCDFNQTAIASLMVLLAQDKSLKFSENLFRHLVLSILKSYRKKFRVEYGELIICCDGRNYWRRGVFPQYKYQRKVQRDLSGFDWQKFFEVFGKIKDELKANFPYRLIDIERCEADDDIAVLVRRFCQTEKILILSTDTDFVQLQKYSDNIKQWSPMQKKFIKPDKSPQEDLKEKIIRGDVGDGVPNILSKDTVFATGGRQRPMTGKLFENFMRGDPTGYEQPASNRFLQNQQLIDLEFIPDEIITLINEEYDKYETAPRSKIFQYMIANGLANLMENIGDF